MLEQDKRSFIAQLDSELPQGGRALSEWSVFLVREADHAFVAGANLAALITAMAAIETHLRLEASQHGDGIRLVDLIEELISEERLRQDLHSLRKYRSRWVHVGTPEDNDTLLADPAAHERELERMAALAIRSIRRTIYAFPWI